MSLADLTVSVLAAQVLVGLAQGMIYVLLALGLSLIFGLLGIVNFAHGSLFVLGAFVGFFVLGLTKSFWAALVLGPMAVGLVGLAIEKILIQPLYDRRTVDDPLLITFGFSLVVVDLVRMIWGKRGVEFSAPPALGGVVDLGITLFPTYRLFVIGLTIVVIAALYLFLARTDLGLMIRAGTRDPVMVRALGVPLRRIRLLVFGLGAGLAGLAGVLAGPMRHVSPEMGIGVVIDAFVVVVVGGMGSISGAVVAGLLIGEAVSLTVLFAPTMGEIVVFVVMAAVLLVRPAGLFGEAGFMD